MNRIEIKELSIINTHFEYLSHNRQYSGCSSLEIFPRSVVSCQVDEVHHVFQSVYDQLLQGMKTRDNKR